MSIAAITTEGFGNGTFVGSIADIVRVGYDVSTPPPVTGNPIDVEPLTGVAIDSTAIDSELF